MTLTTSAPRTLVNATGHPSQHKPDIEAFLLMLAKHTLDPSFEEYGNFVYPHHRSREFRDPTTLELSYEDLGPMDPEHPEDVHIWGNFFDYSYGFSIVSDEPAVIERLTAAIRANQLTPTYLAAKESP